MKRRPLTAVGMLLLAGAFAGCSREAPQPEPPRPVLTAVVGAAAGGESTVYTGEVRSRIEQALAFRVAGKISERLVNAGDTVRPGQLLARLDPTDAVLTASAAEAAQQLAEAEAGRYRELKGRNFVSQAALDARETALKATAAQADLARNQSAYTALRADQPGVVGQVLAEVGQVVAAGQPVFRVSRPDTLEVAIAIPESRLADARHYGDAEVALWADGDTALRGRLREIAATADPQTRTYAARVGLDHPGPRVQLGMSATVRFAAPQAAARLAIPQAALFQKDGKSAVWLVNPDQTVSLRPVEVARYADATVDIAGGLAPGERIVVAGVHKLAVGEKIRVAERTPAAVAAAR
jgi:membrane fusion protein, multidrug efflux system